MKWKEALLEKERKRARRKEKEIKEKEKLINKINLVVLRTSKNEVQARLNKLVTEKAMPWSYKYVFVKGFYVKLQMAKPSSVLTQSQSLYWFSANTKSFYIVFLKLWQSGFDCYRCIGKPRLAYLLSNCTSI